MCRRVGACSRRKPAATDTPRPRIDSLRLGAKGDKFLIPRSLRTPLYLDSPAQTIRCHGKRVEFGLTVRGAVSRHRAGRRKDRWHREGCRALVHGL